MHDDLIERIKQLSEHWARLPLSDELHEQITQVYHKKSLNELLHCVKNVDGSKKSEDQQVSELSEFLKNNWERINGTCMSYTAQPESDLTQLLCEIASVLGLQKTESAIHLLMPGVATESLTDRYKNLTELELKEVLRTHILGQEGRYLIPVTILLDVMQCNYDGSLGGRHNPYYDYKKHVAGHASINDEEYSRLIKHSLATQALHDTTEHSIQIEKQQIDLLSQLNNLCRTLRFNDAHGGIGRAESAGEGAYLAIVQFQEFFSQITPESRDKIPQLLLDEIKLLINLSSDSAQNHNAVENIQTCIGTRREKISSAMKGHEAELESIRLDENSQQALKKQAEAARNKARKELETHCDRKTYKGKDVLGINPSFLQWLEIRFAVHSIADINILMRCSAADIQEIISSNPQLLSCIAEQLHSIELLIGFIVTGHQHAKVNVVLSLLVNHLNYSARDFSSLLLPLNLEQIELVCSAFKDHLKDIIKNCDDWRSVLEFLAPEPRAAVCSSFNEHLKDIIKNGEDFGNALQYLELEQRTAVYNSLKDHFKEIIKESWDFVRVLEYLAPEQRVVVCSLFKDHFTDIINDGEDFRFVLHYLEPEQCIVVCNSLNDHFKDIIKNGEDFVEVVQYLAPGRLAVICGAFKDHFKDIIKNGQDFERVLQHLEPEQRAAVYGSLKDCFKDLIKNGQDFERVLLYLASEQRVAVCDSLKDHFKDIIKNRDDLGKILRGLAPEQCAAVCSALKDHFKDIIKNKDDFGSVLKHLESEQCAVVCSVLNDHLKDIVKNGEDFGSVLQHLAPEQRAVVYSSLNDHFKDIIKNDEDCVNVLRYLAPEQCAAICSALKDHLKDIIKNGWDFGSVLRHLAPEQCTAVCGALNDHFKESIKNSEDFRYVQQRLAPEQRTVVYNALKECIKDIIKNGEDFRYVLMYLEPEQRALVCNSIKDQLKDIIKDGWNFGSILQYLAPEQCALVCRSLKDNFKNIIKNGRDFRCVLERFKPELRTVVGSLLKDHFKDIIKNGRNFGSVLRHLAPEQCTVVCNSLKGHIKNIIKNGRDLGRVLRNLSPEQCTVVCNALKDHLNDIIKNSNDFGNVLRYLTPEQGATVFSMLKDSIRATCLSQAVILDQEKSRKIHQFWFDSLLHNIPVSAAKQAIVNPLKEKLTQASKDFFEQNYTPEGYKTFKKTCQGAINAARPQLRGWDDFFKKLALAIVTIGLAPAIMAVHSKVTKGSFNFSFFPGKEEQSIDNVLNCVGDTPRVK